MKINENMTASDLCGKGGLVQNSGSPIWLSPPL